MSLILLIAITLFTAFIFSKLIRVRRESGLKNLPKGSLGWPVIGETFSFLQSQRKDRGPEWVKERVDKYGKVFKTSLMGSKTVVFVGLAGNKFVLGSDESVFVGKQPKTIAAMGGKSNIFSLTGSRYKLVKGAMLSFLKQENIQNYVGQMDDQVTSLLLNETKEVDILYIVPFMKNVTFEIACTILFGFQDLTIKNIFLDELKVVLEAIWSIPVNFPGTLYRRGLQSRTRLVNHLLPIIRKRKEDLAKGACLPSNDVLSSFAALRDGDEKPITDDEIVDNFITLIIASHDTSAILLSLMVLKMSRDKDIYNKILQEQMEVKKIKEEKGEKKLTWADMQKMKYTWRVAQEMMRIIPPVFGNFRMASKDICFDGFDIPKGWQVMWLSCATHMDENIFHNPKEFDPSRFDNPSRVIPPYAYIPFGGGMHTCIGNEFARVETLTTIHKLVTMFEWSPVHPNEEITRRPMPYPSMGLPVKIKPRMDN
ncbi:taxadiene 5-alpha hydroxylase-like [Impatiens glandulifera]|uniref:taxadiene 5-alpha hydroxylase-like n=1 Tax=Impatiens glandulifera TaxID=253017 RepID=UPI001FB13E77|nr:taxadiene 5-alpha hydroxylase-like [Impatiens glandulifera]